jgi:uncharacterized membrane protein YphA (DoxX/SURF4 family)
MKSLFSNRIFIFLVRIFLGGFFIAAGMDKITNTQAFADSILQYKVVSPTVAMCIATFLPSLELLCGLGVITGLYVRGSKLLMTIMLVSFTILVSSALIRGLDISCGCFSQDPSVSKIGYLKIVENCGLILLSIWLLVVRNQEIDLFHAFRKQSGQSS